MVEVTEQNFTQIVSERMMEIADMFAAALLEADPRAWDHLLVYAPKEKIRALALELDKPRKLKAKSDPVVVVNKSGLERARPYRPTGVVVTKELLLELVGDFTWDFGHQFFIETEVGNFVWSDPDYQGDDTMRLFKGSYNDWIGGQGGFGAFGRSKGRHQISRYCGDKFTLVLDKG